jgi:hypothetical protein
MAARPPQTDAALTRFETYLADHGESVCLASLPMVIDEIAEETSGGDQAVCQQLVAELRVRAGLHT